MILDFYHFQILGCSFPRIRGGDPNYEIGDEYIEELFPAYAGVILIHLLQLKELKPFPRIRGGDPIKAATTNKCVVFSPHTRGGS